MAASSSFSSPTSGSRCNLYVVAAMALFLLVASSSSATRPGALLIMREEGPRAPNGAGTVGRKHYLTAFQLEGQAAGFNFLPKGVPIPPSGPSKRHNSIQN